MRRARPAHAPSPARLGRRLPAAALALMLAPPPGAAQEAPAGTPVETQAHLREAIVGRRPTNEVADFTIDADGTIAGTYLGSAFEGEWDWDVERGLFCRSGRMGEVVVPRGCQRLTRSPGALRVEHVEDGLVEVFAVAPDRGRHGGRGPADVVRRLAGRADRPRPAPPRPARRP